METFKNDELLEPIDFYRKRLKEAFHDNAEKLYDEMTKDAQTDVDNNQQICKKYYTEKQIIDNLTKKNNGRKALKGFMIFMTIVLFIAAAVMIYLGASSKINIGLGIGVGAGCAVLAVVLIVLTVKLSKKIKAIAQEIQNHQGIANKHLSDAYESMGTLLNKYEWNMASQLMSKTTPLIQLDQVFDGDKYQFLHEKYGYEEYKGDDISTIFVQSGSILGNPFVFEKNYVQTMRDHVYTGTLTITWTEVQRDSNGRLHTVTRTQVLTAHYTAPEPCYYLDTWLIYGNEAAPRLSFSRQPTGINDMNDKQIEKYIKSFDKKLDKKVSKEMKDGGASFTRLHNEEFEALFNALDRDNETEFRLLFTPLAQKNMISLLRGKEAAFGDDFIFKKRKMLNFIKSNHMQYSDVLDKAPEALFHFDYKVARDVFINYCDRFLKDVYFDLAPLISIPIYQQHKTIEYIYKHKFAHNVTQAEAECAANSHPVDLMKHPDTRSAGVILKSNFDHKDGASDICNITAYSFRGDDRVEYVPVMGGDGKIHNVPVPWIEYSPINRQSKIVVSDTKMDKAQYESATIEGKFNEIKSRYPQLSNVVYKKRLFSFITRDK